MLVSLPFGLARLQATFLERLPQPLLTRDQVTLLRQDNVVAPDALTLKDLGIAPTAPEAVIETYLDRYRPGGRFGRVRPCGLSRDGSEAAAVPARKTVVEGK